MLGDRTSSSTRRSSATSPLLVRDDARNAKRCSGTTKPPYTLALLAALFRERGHQVRLVDLTATQQSVDQLLARLDGEGFQPESDRLSEYHADACRPMLRRCRR